MVVGLTHLSSFLRIFVRTFTFTPLYPHWLWIRNSKKAKLELVPFFRGRVLETGAGNCENKEFFLTYSKKVKKYVASDFSSWDSEFDNQKNMMGTLLSGIIEPLVGTYKRQEKIDAICDARKLPFSSNSFNTYCSFEMLEHINEPEKVIEEAYRVLKKGSYCIFSMPFLLHEHGGVQMDFQRFTRGGLKYRAQKTGFKVEEIFTRSYFGTTFASMHNQFIIRKIFEGNIFVKTLLILFSPILFTIFNIYGYLIELFDHDVRFARTYFVVLKK